MAEKFYFIKIRLDPPPSFGDNMTIQKYVFGRQTDPVTETGGRAVFSKKFLFLALMAAIVALPLHPAVRSAAADSPPKEPSHTEASAKANTNKDADAKTPGDKLQAAKMYEEALALLKAKDPAGCKAKLKELIALKGVDKYLLSEAWALLADVQLQSGECMQAAKSYEEAISVADTLPGNLYGNTITRWKLLLEVIRKHPTGRYREKPLGDKKVMQEALKELAPPRMKELEELIKKAHKAGYYIKATAMLKKTRGIIEEIEILDAAAAKSAKQKLAVAEEGLLADEIERLISQAEKVRGEALANRPGNPPRKWKPGAAYKNEDEYAEALAYYNRFPKYNDAVRPLDRLARIIQDRIDELEALRNAHSGVKFKKDPKSYTDRLNKLTTDKGQPLVELPLPEKPKLLKERTLIKSTGDRLGPKGRPYDPKKKKKR